MAQLRLIVDGLNAPPFEKNLSLVAFDEKNSFELLQVLNDVFIAMDSKRHDVDLREEADDIRTYRMSTFLKLLKYDFPTNDDNDSFNEGLTSGDRHVIYPILYWALSNLPMHQKRAYLARYLAPLQIPGEFLGDSSLQDLNEHYQELQQEFKHVHKNVDNVRNASGVMTPASLRAEVSQLDEEKSQLKEKIAYLKRKASSDSGFKEIMTVTSELRTEQEEQQKLIDRKHDQQMGIAVAEKRYRETYHHVQELKKTTSGRVTADELFENLRSRVEHHHNVLHNVLPSDLSTKKRILHDLNTKLRAPKKTESDIRALQDQVYNLTTDIEHYNRKIADNSDDKMTIFRNHATAQFKKLSDKQEELQNAVERKKNLSRSVDELETQLSSIAGPKFMKRDEFKKYASSLREKTAEYKRLKSLMAKAMAESVTLSRTEQILKGRCTDIDAYLTLLEEKKGMSNNNNPSLNNTDINVKDKTLEQVSEMVSDLNRTLKSRKNFLAPRIKELRSVRQSFADMEAGYNEKKSIYDNIAIGMESDRLKLEQECQAFQSDCLREERRFHELQCLHSIADANYEKVRSEMEFEKGSGHLLRDFKTFQDLYTQKISQQESLSKELRKQQKALKEASPVTGQQRSTFVQLLSLLKIKNEEASVDEDNNNNGEYNGDAKDSRYVKGSSSSYSQDNTIHVGGANIMTI